MASGGYVVAAGDILVLSQQAWKLQTTFKTDKPEIPREFGEVEQELGNLTKALNSVSEFLDEDQSLLLQSSLGTKKATISILENCQKTLEELDLFTTSYQDVKRITLPNGSRSIQRQWRPTFLKNYDTTIWTNEGGDVKDLRRILALHTEALNLFGEGLQS
jgi:hypothetical protein